MTVADVLKDRSVSMLTAALGVPPGRLEGSFASLEAMCRRDLEAEGIDAGRVRMERSIDARYRGQSYEINVPRVEGWVDLFHEEHRRLYGFSRKTEPVEIVTLRVRGIGRIEPPPERRVEGARGGLETPRAAARAIVWKGIPTEAGLCDRLALPADVWVAGALLIVESGATTFVPPGWRARQDARGHLHLQPETGA